LDYQIFIETDKVKNLNTSFNIFRKFKIFKMNYNIISYIIYLPVIFFITIKVGWMFYKNGELFLVDVFGNDIDLIKKTNSLLLTGYYLVNLGYSILTISLWEKINHTIELINVMSTTLGKIIVLLALLHYNNIFWLKYLTKSNIIKQ